MRRRRQAFETTHSTAEAISLKARDLRKERAGQHLEPLRRDQSLQIMSAVDTERIEADMKEVVRRGKLTRRQVHTARQLIGSPSFSTESDSDASGAPSMPREGGATRADAEGTEMVRAKPA
jgi:hypothetical protein